MAVGTFTITELPASPGRVPGGVGEIFEWTSDKHSAPLKPWTIPGMNQTVRTDYPGAKIPSEQSFGPRHGETTFRGRWIDKFNTPGFAMETKRRFEAMCRRCNPIAVAFRDLSYEGVIKSWSFDIDLLWDIGYEFTVSIHTSADDDIDQRKSEPTVLSSSDLTSRTTELVDQIEGVAGAAPSAAMFGTLSEDMRDQIVALQVSQQQVVDAVDLRTLREEVEPIDALHRIGAGFRYMRNRSRAITDLLAPQRSDTALGYQHPIRLLDFEVWLRGTGYACRQLIGQANRSAIEVDTRAAPDALALHRPFAGESLYDIARRYYGTPFAWRLISERNNLDGPLTGDEILVIPNRSPG